MQEARRQRIVDEQYGSTTSRLDRRMALHRRFATSPVDWQHWVFDQLDLTGTGSVVELGAGTGALWQRNRDRIPAGVQFLLSDRSPAMCAQLRDLRLPGAAVVRSDAIALPLRDASVGAVIANHMLYHVSSLETALAEAARVLRDGGRLYAATNGRVHMRELEEVAEQIGVPYASMRLHHPFVLEDAVAHLQPFFDDVVLVRFADDLAVTEPEPVAEYLHSVVELTDRQRQQLLEIVGGAIAADGAFRITKSSGLVTGVKC